MDTKQISFVKAQAFYYITNNIPLVSIFALGFLVRLLPSIMSHFPLGDGGLFFVMAQDLVNNNLRIPIYTSYNNINIPFTYPPFGVYALIALKIIFNASSFDILRLGPPIIAGFSVIGFYFLSRQLLPKRSSLLGTCIFACVPNALTYFTLGGGITRSFGLLFTILTLYSFMLLLKAPTVKNAVLTGLLAALTFLSHPNAGLELALGMIILSIFSPRKIIANLKYVFLSGVIFLVIFAPWFIYVFILHGIGPFSTLITVGGHDGPRYLRFIVMPFASEPVVGFIQGVAILGIILCISENRWIFPLWIFLSLAIDSRFGIPYSSIPVSLVTGILIDRISGFRLKPLTLGIVVTILAVNAIQSIRAFPSISKTDIRAMIWIEKNTPEDSDFYVQASHYSLEWFPAITYRKSITTIQGREWIPDINFEKTWNDIDRHLLCEDVNCIEEWEPGFNFVYTDSIILQSDLDQHNGYTLVYEDEGLHIYARKTVNTDM